jgi:hypothetical protein
MGAPTRPGSVSEPACRASSAPGPPAPLASLSAGRSRRPRRGRADAGRRRRASPPAPGSPARDPAAPPPRVHPFRAPGAVEQHHAVHQLVQHRGQPSRLPCRLLLRGSHATQELGGAQDRSRLSAHGPGERHSALLEASAVLVRVPHGQAHQVTRDVSGTVSRAPAGPLPRPFRRSPPARRPRPGTARPWPRAPPGEAGGRWVPGRSGTHPPGAGNPGGRGPG